SDRVRKKLQSAEIMYCSALCIAEMSCTLHRGVREQIITRGHASSLVETFSRDLSRGLIQLIPVSESILRVVEAVVPNLPPTIFIRAGDAVHLASAQSAG